MKDLSPIETVELPQRTLFRVFVFEISIDRLLDFQQVFEPLDSESLRFVDSKAFEANNFIAAMGSAQNWQGVAAVLDKLKAERKEIKRLVIYGDSENDIVVTTLSSSQRVSFYGNNGKSVDREFLAGRFSWTIRARPTPSMRGVAQVEIRPIFRMGADSYISRLAQFRNLMPLDPAAFALKMSKGDFVLLAPTRVPDNNLTLNRLLFASPEKDSVVRVYMVACLGVGD